MWREVWRKLICQVKVGAATETVTVAAQALSVQTEDPKVSRVITDTQMHGAGSRR